VRYILPAVFISALLASSLGLAGEFYGKVVAVMDGDTLMVMRGNQRVKVRLAEIDAPEKTQAYGNESRQSLEKMVMGKTIQVTSRAVDDYGRIVAMLNVEGLNVNHEQVRLGMAWEYSRFHNNGEVLKLQHEAQQDKRGLWAGEEIVEPSQWRKLHPSTLKTVAQADPACEKKRCSQMASCEEARDYFARCGKKTLDGDNDGMPCESLCMPNKNVKN